MHIRVAATSAACDEVREADTAAAAWALTPMNEFSKVSVLVYSLE